MQTRYVATPNSASPTGFHKNIEKCGIGEERFTAKIAASKEERWTTRGVSVEEARTR